MVLWCLAGFLVCYSATMVSEAAYSWAEGHLRSRAAVAALHLVTVHREYMCVYIHIHIYIYIYVNTYTYTCVYL